MSLTIENPLEASMDVGKSSFRINLIKRAFEVNFKLLLSHVTAPVDPPVSILAEILPPERWMKMREIGPSDKNLGRYIELPGAAGGATGRWEEEEEEEEEEEKEEVRS